MHRRRLRLSSCVPLLLALTGCRGDSATSPPGPELAVWAAVRAGGGVAIELTAHSCALSTDGKGFCWGNNEFGQLGTGTTTRSRTPVPVSGELTFTVISTGGFHTCALTSGDTAYCWGSSLFGEVGNPAAAGRQTTPIQVAGGLAFASLSTGFVHTCAVTLTGDAYCWGRNREGRLGDGTTVSRPTPVPVVGGLRFTDLSAGGGTPVG